METCTEIQSLRGEYIQPFLFIRTATWLFLLKHPYFGGNNNQEILNNDKGLVSCE